MSQFETTKLHPIQESGNEAQDILLYVYNALQAKGYDPITQLVGYIISGDPTYITSYNSARSMICRLERDEILEELVRFYLAGHTPKQSCPLVFSATLAEVYLLTPFLRH